MQFIKGDLVRHPNLPDWGLGKVLENSSDRAVRVFFVGAGDRCISLQHVKLTKTMGEEGHYPLLDNLSAPNLEKQPTYQSPRECIDAFLALFPQGFYDQKYLTNERDHKYQAHLTATELLSQQVVDDLLEREDYAAVTNAALRVVNATKLIFPNEKTALKDRSVS